jgi:hypothetical protein
VADAYYAVPYLRGCGELIVEHTTVDESEPGFVTITVTAYVPEKAE